MDKHVILAEVERLVHVYSGLSSEVCIVSRVERVAGERTWMVPAIEVYGTLDLHFKINEILGAMELASRKVAESAESAARG